MRKAAKEVSEKPSERCDGADADSSRRVERLTADTDLRGPN